jgi:hypothetical protein
MADDYFVCPCCGADVKAGKNFCRECGASDDFGWREEGLSDDEVDDGYAGEGDFDYEEFVEREFGSATTPLVRLRNRPFYIMIIVLVCIGLAIISILGM